MSYRRSIGYGAYGEAATATSGDSKPLPSLTAAIALLPSKESCRAKGLCFKGAIYSSRRGGGISSPASCISCPTHLYEWVCNKAQVRSRPCQYPVLSSEDEKLYCKEAKPSESDDSIKCGCCPKPKYAQALRVRHEWTSVEILGHTCLGQRSGDYCGPRPEEELSPLVTWQCCPIAKDAALQADLLLKKPGVTPITPTSRAKKLFGLPIKHLLIGVVGLLAIAALVSK